jgi:hypothetical protein
LTGFEPSHERFEFLHGRFVAGRGVAPLGRRLMGFHVERSPGIAVF